jgi:hypothetical protein
MASRRLIGFEKDEVRFPDIEERFLTAARSGEHDSGNEKQK